MEQYGLSAYDAGLLTAEKATADYFDSVIAVRPAGGDALAKLAKSTGNWMLGELTRLMKETDTRIGDVRVRPTQLVELIDMVDEGKLSSNPGQGRLRADVRDGPRPRRDCGRIGASCR